MPKITVFGICDALYKNTLNSLIMEQTMDSDNVYCCDNFDDNIDLEFEVQESCDVDIDDHNVLKCAPDGVKYLK